tara:strand:+ start:5910 stop:6638 length:729 start_codon:yes stop_codon:yes gene_type:complete
MRTRLIAKLEIKTDNVVKPIYFEGLKIVGNPTILAKKYYEDGIDELILIDIVSSLYRRTINYKLIEKISKDIFIPITVGGGIRSIDQISKILENGADKVSINTFALQSKPDFINHAARKFGSQCITVNIEAKMIGNKWICLSDGGRVISNIDVLDWIKELEDRGAGEILIQSVDKDGAKRGFDLQLLNKIKQIVNIPIIAASGAGNMKHIKELKDLINPDAICLASVLHYKNLKIRNIKKII